MSAWDNDLDFVEIALDPSWAGSRSTCYSCHRELAWSDAVMLPTSSYEAEPDGAVFVHFGGCPAEPMEGSSS